MRAVQDAFGGGQQAEDDGGFFFGETGLDDEAAELDFAPGSAAAAFGVSGALHLHQIAPDQRPGALEQPCGLSFCGERKRRAAALPRPRAAGKWAAKRPKGVEEISSAAKQGK